MMCLLMPVFSWAGGAEFALRWSSGGPVSADEAVTVMGLEGSRKVTAYEVEYFTVLAPPVPQTRRRSAGGGSGPTARSS